ncbi:nucleotide kinase domain-containing protein [Kocuria marina]|uniref:nucleotide kinase domain-containing protein n=1 Tax=Kocuria marina TaxID=223184 RepID=UPI0011A4E73F|nr:nucleotide kinase domain-containing protein [Kocuria indica]
MRRVRIGRRSVVVSEVLPSYWRFAAERQHVYHARLRGESAPWTDDPVISRFRFTNAYRAADRVSQDLIRITYAGSQEPEDLALRVLLFRFFNKPSTWSVLEDRFGEIATDSFDVDAFSEVLDGLLLRGERVYSAAYIVPPPPFGATRKHRNHLLLIEHMMRSRITERLTGAASLRDVFETISSFPSLGPFLSYQLAIDLNYTTLLDFDENDFVMPGPGARSGIAKCFPDLGGLPAEELIRWMVDTQEEQFEQNGIAFEDLFGRSLTLIDCQNLFCETDKYARVMHPHVRGVGSRSRIKQQFAPLGSPGTPFFPPKWGINYPAAPETLRAAAGV